MQPVDPLAGIAGVMAPAEAGESVINRPLPAYKSHKTVRALKIATIGDHPNPDPTGNSVASSYGATLFFADPGYDPLIVSAEYMTKHKPQDGGYWVQYADGYQSYSPAKAFEEGYTRQGTEGKPLSLEQAIVAAGAGVAPRVTPNQAEAAIASEHYFTAAQAVQGECILAAALERIEATLIHTGETQEEYRDTIYQRVDDVGKPTFVMATTPAPLALLTICVLVLRNGYTVTGESACASPENYNKAIGERIARENAVRKIWPLLGYQLRDHLHASAASATFGAPA